MTTTRSCLIATTPHCGGQVLAAAVSAAGGLGDPREYFRPDRIPDRAAAWGVAAGGGGFVGRYLDACLATATPAVDPSGSSVFSVLLQWPHGNWLVRAARTEGIGGATLDADVIAACLPAPRWVHVTRPDTDRQAVAWWRARHGRRRPVLFDSDLLEIRWLETILVRRHEAWRHFFRRHGIDPLTLTLAEVLADAPASVERISAHVGDVAPPPMPTGPDRGATVADRPEPVLRAYRGGARRAAEPPGPRRRQPAGVVNPPGPGRRPLRILFSVRPFHGHFHPLVPLALALQRAGHRVAVATADELGGTVLAAGLAWIPTGLHPATAEAIFEDDPHVDYGYQIVGGKVAELVDTLLADFRADLVVREPTDLAPALAAEIVGIPCVDFGVAHFIPVHSWRILAADETVAALRRDYGLAPDPDLDCLYRGLYLAVVPPEMEDIDPLPVPSVLPLRYETWDAASGDAGPAAWLDELPDRPTVLLTLGTVFNSRTDVFAAALEALGTEDVNVVCTLGADQDPGALGVVPPNVRVERYLPHSAVLPRCRLMVCHMGFNTMMGALCAGVPLVSVALGSDQLHNARRAEELGLARHVPPEELTAETIRAAVRTVLYDSSYARRVAVFAAAVAARPGLDEAVAQLEFLGRSVATPSWWAIGQNEPARRDPPPAGATTAGPVPGPVPGPAANDRGRDLL